MATGYYSKNPKMRMSRTVVCKHGGLIGNILIPHQYQDKILEFGLLPAKPKANMCCKALKQFCPYGNDCPNVVHFIDKKIRGESQSKARMSMNKRVKNMEKLLQKYEKPIIFGELIYSEYNSYKNNIRRNNRTKSFKRIVDKLIVDFPPELRPNIYDVLFWIDKTNDLEDIKVITSINNTMECIVLSMLLFTLNPDDWFIYDLNVCRQYRLGKSDYKTIIENLKGLGII